VKEPKLIIVVLFPRLVYLANIPKRNKFLLAKQTKSVRRRKNQRMTQEKMFIHF